MRRFLRLADLATVYRLPPAFTANPSGGVINMAGGTNAAPTGTAIRAKNVLITGGWTVTTT